MTANAAAPGRRGQPLVALAVLLVAWTAARFVLWESPFARAARASVERAGATAAPVAEETPMVALSPPNRDRAWSIGWMPGPAVAPHPPTRVRADPVPTSDKLPLFGPYNIPTLQRAPLGAAPIIVQPAPAPERLAERRLHLAGWAAWREGSGLPTVANGALPPSYGGSQVGLLAQFDLAEGARRPALHLRATYSPDRPRQSEIAAGIGMRPMPAVPLRVLGEVRATHVEGRTEVRPALFAVTELAPVSLPFGLRGEGYAQGGWVGGRYATAFADGQARVTHAVVAAGPAQLRFGAGAWGGAQKFAERLDVGPTVTAELAPIHLSLDYRMRVAGNARPGNGLALTLSTGF